MDYSEFFDTQKVSNESAELSIRRYRMISQNLTDETSMANDSLELSTRRKRIMANQVQPEKLTKANEVRSCDTTVVAVHDPP